MAGRIRTGAAGITTPSAAATPRPQLDFGAGLWRCTPVYIRCIAKVRASACRIAHMCAICLEPDARICHSPNYGRRCSHLCVTGDSGADISRGPFSLSRGLNSELTSFQAEHHLSMQFRFGHKKGRPDRVALARLVCARSLGRAPPSEGMALSARARRLEPINARQRRRDDHRAGLE